MTFNYQNHTIKDYLVKITSNIYIYILHFLLFVFVENHMFYTLDLGIDFLTLKMTLKKTFNHQQNTINGFLVKNHTEQNMKLVLHLFVVLFAANHIFFSLDLEIEVLTLR